MPMAALWDQLPGESSKAFQAFCIFRDLGPGRCLDEASRRYHQRRRMPADGTIPARQPRASGTIRRWATRWNWTHRTMAWDLKLDQVKREQQIAAVKEMSDRTTFMRHPSLDAGEAATDLATE